MNTNNEGFTLVEIIVTFTLVSVISFLLFQLILSLKDVYTSSDLRTIFLTEQGNMTRRINTDFFTYELQEANLCSDKTKSSGSKKCYEFTLFNNVTDETTTKILEIFDDSIIYDGYAMPINNNSVLGIPSAVVSYIKDSSVRYNCILTFDFPVTNPLVEGDYGIHFSVLYNNIYTDLNKEMLDDYHQIEIVTTTVSDIRHKDVSSGDGLYNITGEEWYDSGVPNFSKFIFKGEMPNNYVIFNKKCFRIIAITNDDSLKIIYESNSDNGRCATINSSGTISDGTDDSWSTLTNNWFSNDSIHRVYTLNDWYDKQNFNENRLITSSFFVGAVEGSVEKLKDLVTQQRTNKGLSDLPSRSNYVYSSKIGMISTSDYIMASTNAGCGSMINAVNTNNCKKDNYLYKSAYSYWTINAYAANATDVWVVNKNGKLVETNAESSGISVRPVLFLKSTTKFSGTGTNNDPYVVK